MVDLAESKGQGRTRPSFLKVQAELAKRQFQIPWFRFPNLALLVVILF
jgi:hypothetical protein